MKSRMHDECTNEMIAVYGFCDPTLPVPECWCDDCIVFARGISQSELWGPYDVDTIVVALQYAMRSNSSVAKEIARRLLEGGWDQSMDELVEVASILAEEENQ